MNTEKTHHPAVSTVSLDRQTHLTHLKKTAALLCQDVQLVQIQGCLRDRGTRRDGRSPLLHEGQQLVQPGPSLRLVIHVV